MKILANIEHIANTLGKATKSGNGYQCLCPAHEDKNPSLSITEVNGKLLFHCHAGCSYESIQREIKRSGRYQFAERTSSSKHESNERDGREQVRKKAKFIWNSSKEADPNHPYLKSKGVKPYNIRQDERGNLIVPVTSGEYIESIQFIYPITLSNGSNKNFLKDARIAGNYYIIGDVKKFDTICIAEGYATSASIHEATSLPTVVAFNSGNIGPVGEAIRNRFPLYKIIICADDDFTKKENKGLELAKETAYSIGGYLAVPNYGEVRPLESTDFNDLHASHGLEAVRNCIELAKEISNVDMWKDPEPLCDIAKPLPYPINDLPEILRDAVCEVQRYNKAPIPLLTSSAITALATASQALYDVARDSVLRSPVSLFCLTIAESGERKSACDKIFTRPLYEYEKEQRIQAKETLNEYKSAYGIWESKITGTLDAIKKKAKGGQVKEEPRDLELILRELQNQQPKCPKIPKLIRKDETPESLVWALFDEWPSCGLISSEGGVILGGYANGKDSIMRNLSQQNELWDGGSIDIGRKTSQSFKLNNGRLTVGIQVQELTLRKYIADSDGLVRGIGFFSRFLIAQPESTQGTRFYEEPPETLPKVDAYTERLKSILYREVIFDENGELKQILLILSKEAKEAWKTFHDQTEKELSPYGEFKEIKDVASKSADNVARLSALFHILVNDNPNIEIQKSSVDSAISCVKWHLNEALRFFDLLCLSEDEDKKHKLDNWLITYCKEKSLEKVPVKDIQQRGPRSTRKKVDLDSVIKQLEALNRVRCLEEGGKKFVLVNPKLLIR